ncbi:MAG: hypothetical protein ACRDSN_18680 [Pseudonocardiaceae bacterium]
MAKYVLVYRGGGMPEGEAEQQAELAAWGAWFGGLGEAVVDGGNPFGPSKTLSVDGAASDGGASGLTGYSVISAASLDDAAGKAKGCPILNSGGTVEVYETFDVM